MSHRNFLLLEQDIVPCWYEIGFDKDNVALVVKVHEEFLWHLPGPRYWREVSPLMQQFGFLRFDEDFYGNSFGFDGAFKWLEKEGPFLVFSAEVPVLEKFRMKICSYCQGHKKGLLFGEECPVCHGSGEEKQMRICSLCAGDKVDIFGDECRQCQGKGQNPNSYMDWLSLQAISATLMVFSGRMFFGTETDKLTSSNFPQLISIEAHINKEMHSAPLSGVYGLPLVEWFKKNPDCKIFEAQEAMKKTWMKIHGRFNDFDEMNTWAAIGENGLFSINCPGDRTGLISDAPYDIGRRNEGYKFYCHNLDTPAQQITLLAGLGALCDKVRKETK